MSYFIGLVKFCEGFSRNGLRLRIDELEVGVDIFFIVAVIARLILMCCCSPVGFEELE
jgi:hypothetical protein